MTRPDFKKIKEEHGAKLPKFAGGSWASTVWHSFPISENIIYNLDEYSSVEMIPCEKGAPCFHIEIDGDTMAPQPYKHEIWLNASREAMRLIHKRLKNTDRKADDAFDNIDHLIAQHADFYALFVAYVSDPELKEERDFLPDYD